MTRWAECFCRCGDRSCRVIHWHPACPRHGDGTLWWKRRLAAIERHHQAQEDEAS